MATNWQNTCLHQQHCLTKMPILQPSYQTHNHIFWCPNTQRQQVTKNCLAQIDLINLRWRVPKPISTSIWAQLISWTKEDPEPPAEQIATNLHSTAVIQAQTQIRWGHFFKGFCASDIQKNSQHTVRQPAQRI
jgi:hypothetical protein